MTLVKGMDLFAQTKLCTSTRLMWQPRRECWTSLKPLTLSGSRRSLTVTKLVSTTGAAPRETNQWMQCGKPPIIKEFVRAVILPSPRTRSIVQPGVFCLLANDCVGAMGPSRRRQRPLLLGLGLRVPPRLVSSPAPPCLPAMVPMVTIAMTLVEGMGWFAQTKPCTSTRLKWQPRRE